MKKILVYLLFIISYLLLPTFVYAEYVLPYPSFMPGNKIYAITRIVDKLKNYWYFGEIAQQKYHLGLGDKYLVEAKTLFEYKQYLLAADALSRSDKEFSLLQKTPLAVEAAKKHVEVLESLKSTTPQEFTWSPEKVAASTLHLGSMIQSSITIRERLWQ